MKKVFLFLMLILSSASALADGWYFFNPSVGYYQGHYNSYKTSGIGFNIKGGFNWGKAFIGADIDYAQGLNASDVSYDIDVQNTGVLLGYGVGGLRIWYSMITAASVAYKNGSNEDTVTGSGTKLGLGGKLSGTTFINLEASFLDYDERDRNGSTSDVDQFMDLVLLSFGWVL